MVNYTGYSLYKRQKSLFYKKDSVFKSHTTLSRRRAKTMMRLRELMRQEKAKRAQKEVLEDRKKSKPRDVKTNLALNGKEQPSEDHEITNAVENPIKKCRIHEEHNTPQQNPHGLSQTLPSDFFDEEKEFVSTTQSSGIKLPHDPHWVSNIYNTDAFRMGESYFVEPDDTSPSLLKDVGEATPDTDLPDLQLKPKDQWLLYQEPDKSQSKHSPGENEITLPDDFFDNDTLAPDDYKKKRVEKKERRLVDQLELFNQEIKAVETHTNLDGNPYSSSDTEYSLEDSEIVLDTTGHLDHFLHNIKELKTSTTNESKKQVSQGPHHQCLDQLSPLDEQDDQEIALVDNISWRKKSLKK